MSIIKVSEDEQPSYTQHAVGLDCNILVWYINDICMKNAWKSSRLCPRLI